MFADPAGNVFGLTKAEARATADEAKAFTSARRARLHVKMGRAVIQHPSASFAFTARCRIVNRPGMLGQLTSAIGSVGGDIRALDIVRVEGSGIVADITVLAADADHAQKLIERMSSGPRRRGARVLGPHLPRASRAARSRSPRVIAIRTRDDLSMVYTPGVARICHGHR